MKEDILLKREFFKNLKFIFTAAAALDQATYEDMQQMSLEERGETLPFLGRGIGYHQNLTRLNLSILEN